MTPTPCQRWTERRARYRPAGERIDPARLIPWSLAAQTPRILNALRGDPMTPARLAAQLAAAIRSAPPPG